MKFFLYVHSEGASEWRFHGHTASPPPLLGAPFLGSVQGVSATGLLGTVGGLAVLGCFRGHRVALPEESTQIIFTL